MLGRSTTLQHSCMLPSRLLVYLRDKIIAFVMAGINRRSGSGVSVFLAVSFVVHVYEQMFLSNLMPSSHFLVVWNSGGIGKGIAIKLAEHGANIMAHYNSRKEGAVETCKSIRSAGNSCEGILHCDFRSPKAIDDMFSTLDGRWEGELDILVNNAGIVSKFAMEDENDDLSVWHETMAVNLHAPVQLSRLAHQRMKTKGDGVIVMNSSIHGTVSVEWMIAYAASKAALDQVTRGLSSEWAADGIRVNSVAPGVVPVERTEAVLNSPDSQKLWLPHLPVGRMGSVDDISEAVAYICSAKWMSGSVLTIDGGMTAR